VGRPDATVTPWGFAVCGLAFVAAALWLAWRESRSWPRSNPAAAGIAGQDMSESKL